MFIYVEMRKYMKKKLFSVLLVGALAASLVACGKTEKKEAKASTANTEINAEEYAGTITSNAGVYKTFVNLSDWKGMSVDLKESDYVVLDSDVEDYIKTKEGVLADYEDRKTWAKKALVNISKAGFFSSDRTIAEYNKDIWRL